MNFHPKVIAAGAGSIVGAVVAAAVAALVAQCGGQDAIIQTLVAVGLPLIGALAAGYARPSGSWTPAAAAIPPAK